MKKCLIVLAALMLVVSTGFAIESGGNVDGTVHLEDGNVVPGVAVEISGENMMGKKTTVSNENGYFRFSNVKVGNYQLIFELEGFKKVIRKNIYSSLGKTTTVDILMEMGSIKEEIQVVANLPVVDMKSSTQQVNISKAVVETLANDRQYQSIMEMMPGAIPGNNPSMMGASDSDNMYQVDGMDSTDPETKTWSTAMNFDNFEEMQVVAQGASAEYGRGTGAVINVVTKSGSNKLHGTARISMTKTDWNAKQSGDRYYFDDATKYLNETRPSINLGGPILKDRLWFFGSWEKRNKWKPGAIYTNWSQWYNEDIQETKQYYQGHYASGKLTLNLGSHSLMGMWSEDPITIPDLYAYIGYNFISPDSDLDREQGGWNGNAEWTSTLGANTYAVARFAMKRGELNNAPKNELPIHRMGGVYVNGSLREYLTTREFEQYIFNLSHFADTSFGYHDLKVGFEYLNIHNSKQNNWAPGGAEIAWRPDGVTTWYKNVYEPKTDATNKYNTMMTFFLQDKWEVTKGLTMNIGLRVEGGSWKNHAKTEVLKFGLGDMLAPRIGAAYQIGKNKLSANWGKYFDAYGWDLVENMQPDVFSRTYDYFQGTYYGHADWTYISTDVDQGGSSDTEIDSDLKPQFMSEWGLGYERALGTKFSVGINYLNRSWKNKIENLDVNSTTGVFDGDGAFYYKTETDYHDQNESWGATYKKYSAVMVNFKKNLGDDKFQFMANYTYSKLRGFFDASDESTFENGWGKSPYYYINRLGWLDNDARHMFKFYGSVILPYDVILGCNFYWFSGQPFTEDVNAYYAETGKEYNLYIEERGSQRYPATWRMDFRLEKKFRFKDLFSASVYIDCFNILNNQVELVRNNGQGTATFDGLNSDGTVNYTITDPSVTYGRYTEWFPPMSFFLGAKIEW